MNLLLRHERKVAWLLFPSMLVLAYFVGRGQQAQIIRRLAVDEASTSSSGEPSREPEIKSPETYQPPERDERWWEYYGGDELRYFKPEEIAPKWRKEAFDPERKPLPPPPRRRPW